MIVSNRHDAVLCISICQFTRIKLLPESPQECDDSAFAGVQNVDDTSYWNVCKLQYCTDYNLSNQSLEILTMVHIFCTDNAGQLGHSFSQNGYTVTLEMFGIKSRFVFGTSKLRGPNPSSLSLIFTHFGIIPPAPANPSY